MANKPNALNPFPGIRSFRASEHHLFFGREQQIKDVLTILEHNRFLAVVGSSGCGKSSLVQAGLIPEITKIPTPADLLGKWQVTLFTPGNEPIKNMATALHTTLRNQLYDAQGIKLASELEEMLAQSENSLFEIVRRLEPHYKQNYLIIVDQFEEVFRLRHTSRETDRKAITARFIAILLDIVRNKEAPVYLVITMRSDFIDDCTEFRGLNEMINAGSYLVPRMNRHEISRAITQPVLVSEREITPKVTRQMLNDLGDNYDKLPVLQHALMRCWDYHDNYSNRSQPIDLNHYTQIGTIRESLSIHAEEIYNSLPDQRSRELTERLFKTLTILGSDNRATRKPTSLEEICRVAGASEEEMILIIDRFRSEGNSFLMPPPEVPLHSHSIIDISHESIMRVWVRLREWVDEETKSAEVYLRLARSAELYQQGNAGLWENPELELALNWQAKNQPNYHWALRYNPTFDRAMEFLEHSRKEYERKIAEAERKRQKELRRARYFAIVLGTAAILSLLLLIFALTLKFQADKNRREAEQKEQLALQKSREAQEQSRRAVSQKRIADQQEQIAMQQKRFTELEKAYAIEQQNVAIRQRQLAEEATQTAQVMQRRAEALADSAMLANEEARRQKEIALAQKDTAETQRREAQRLRLLTLTRSLAIKASNIYENNNDSLGVSLALTAYQLQKAYKGNLNDPEIFNALLDVSGEPDIYKGHNDGVRNVTFTADGKTFASCSDNDTIRIWSLSNPGQVQHKLTVGKRRQLASQVENRFNTLLGFESQTRSHLNFRSLAFNPAGTVLAAGSHQGKIVFWNIAEQQDENGIEFQAHQGMINAMTFNSTGQMLVTAGADSTLAIWKYHQLKFGEAEKIRFNSPLNDVVFNEQGNQLAVVTQGGQLAVVDMKNFRFEVLQQAGTPLRAVAFSTDGNFLAAGDFKGKIVLWDIATLHRVDEFIGHSSGINDLAFSPVVADSTFASCSYDGTIRLWNYNNSSNEPVIIDKHSSWVYSIAYTPDGQQLISGSADRSIRTWPTYAETLAQQIAAKNPPPLTDEQWNQYIGSDIERPEE